MVGGSGAGGISANMPHDKHDDKHGQDNLPGILYLSFTAAEACWIFGVEKHVSLQFPLNKKKVRIGSFLG